MVDLVSRFPDSKAIENYVAGRKQLMREALADGARAAADEGAKRLLEGPATGAIYRSRRGKGHRPRMASYPGASGLFERGETHQASAPGESPHEDTGEARKGIQVSLRANRGSHPMTSAGWTGKEAVKMRALNDGNSSGTIAPRPILPHMTKAGIKAIRARIRGEKTLSVHGQSAYYGQDWGYEHS